jgi:hypothetical protein
VIVFTVFLGSSFRLATLCALVLPACFVLNYTVMITDPRITRDQDLSTSGVVAEPRDGVRKRTTQSTGVDSDSSSGNDSDVELLLHSSTSRSASSTSPTTASASYGSSSTPPPVEEEDLSLAASSMTARERLSATVALWPFMVPLFVVYFAEYAMQSGAWAAIGASLTYLLTHLLTYLLTHSLTHSLTHLFTRSYANVLSLPTNILILPLARSFTHSSMVSCCVGFPVDSENARDLFYEYRCVHV